MKRILSVLCLLAVILSCAASAFAEGPDWASAYRAVLDEALAKRNAENPGDFLAECSYCLYDIDKDGTPELLLKTGTCEADYMGRIFFFDGRRASQLGEELSLSHSSFYTDPNENGVIIFGGHMGYARASRVTFTDGFGMELLYEDDLNARLEKDPDSSYVYPGDVIPGAVLLTLVRAELSLPLSRYDQVGSILSGDFPEAAGTYYPQDNEEVFDWIISNNAGVYAVAADNYSRSPGWIGFQDLLKKGAADEWMSGDLSVRSKQTADLNGDGKLECVIEVFGGDYDRMRFVLSEQDGVFYAYLMNYVNDLTIDRHGNFHETIYDYSSLNRLIFDGPEAFLLSLPLSYFAD